MSGRRLDSTARKRPRVTDIAGRLAAHGSAKDIKTLRKQGYLRRGTELAQRTAVDFNRNEQMADLEALLSVSERMRRLEREGAQRQISALNAQVRRLNTEIERPRRSRRRER